MESVTELQHSDDDEFKPDATRIDAVAALRDTPQKQLSALRRRLGVNRLLHHTVSGSRSSPKDRFQFISICHSCLGDTFSSLFPDQTDDEIYQFEVDRVWSAVVEKLSQISVQNPARLRLELHTLSRENFSSVKRFANKVFLLCSATMCCWQGYL